MNRPAVIWPGALGAVANVGTTWRACWSGLLEGRRCFSPVQRFFPEMPPGPPVAGIETLPGSPPPIEVRLERLAEWVTGQIACAVHDFVEKHPSARVGLVVSTSHGEAGVVSAIVDNDVLGGALELPDATYQRLLFDETASGVCRMLGLPLPSSTVTSACASATVAASQAYDQIRLGLFDACLVVTADALSRIAYAGFRQLGAMSTAGCRPFDPARDGTTVGEGATAFFLVGSDLANEATESVALVGTGITCDAHHMVEPDLDGIVAAIEQALDDAGLKPTQLRAIVWHGSGTVLNDTTEAAAALRLFGSHSPPSTAAKGTLGHTFGSAGGFNILIGYEALRTGLLPPVALLQDHEFPWLDLVRDAPRRIEPGPILTVSLGFGGTNAAAVLAPGSWAFGS